MNNLIGKMKEIVNKNRKNEKPYEFYEKINPNISKEMYNFLRGNGGLWKAYCGERVVRDFGNEILPELWYLQQPERKIEWYKMITKNNEENNEKES